ncbi:phosphatidylethanolamine-binding protein [Gilbertella persicaria]|uniref:phosphatidylethanolamine-binding protein n=1 Tax=Gilbertella persicaria TaxID=101096 RepID=UPI00221EB16D|nr:phosphatidylethanolamine-binding protein [Gilbertella persicaria]KAI8066227.1 phosphatidylethanolamine-binding protein [Gilbertella persicaria]
MTFITAETNINGALEKVGLIPDVIPNDISPSTLLQIEFPKSSKDVALGNQLSPQDASEQPKVSFVAPESSDYYTLVMTDPDAPSAHDRKFGPWRHWVVVNISGSNIENSLTKAENQHTPYVGPGPGENTGVHRYTFLLYKQLKGGNQTFKPMEHEQREYRRKFDIPAFVAENELELVSVNFFTCPT